MAFITTFSLVLFIIIFLFIAYISLYQIYDILLSIKEDKNYTEDKKST